ncbi:TetR/AcrR family transcriptional regulator [Rhodococcus sp. NPDC127530]|uniref:TetR/AcrR family transcriptional regulator n=1 Tax=unclassified Rhodococcus (in: high G+C Gram-positive bacteria) TaxID=192944 RepID=UPI0036289ECA
MKKSEVTRQRLLTAALQEFSEFGIAGARVDRIASRSGANKSLIYHYFGSKNVLFEETYLQLVLSKYTKIPLDDFDLVRFADALFREYEDHPEILRVLGWYRLHSSSLPRLDAAIAEAVAPVRLAVTRAQETGKLPNNVSADQLLTMTTSIAEAPYSAAAEMFEVFDGPAHSQARHFVRRGVRLLLEGLAAEGEHAPREASRKTPAGY